MSPEKFQRDGARLSLYRDGPDWEAEPTCTIGGFACESAEAGAALLAEIAALCRAEGARALIGPMDGDTWHSYRLVTESGARPPFLMEPTSKPQALDAFTMAGFTPISQYFSASVPTSEVAGAALPEIDGLHVEPWDGSDPVALFTQVHALSCQAFSRNPFYKPIDLDAFLSLYLPFVPMMKRELILFARDDAGALAGFLFGIPNYAEGPAPSAAILKTYASLKKGAGFALSSHFYHAAQGLGYASVIHALMHEDNLSALRSAANGAEIFRRYALMGLRLD